MRILTCLLVALLVAGCSSIKVSSDYDREANFASYKTYAFAPDAKELPVNDINRKRIMDAVARQMAAKGFQPSEQPDVLVDLKLAAEKKQTATANSTPAYYGGGYRYAWGGGFTTTTINVENYLEGTLFVDIIDAAKQQLVWQGRAVKTIDPDASSEERESNIDEAVKQIFSRYPPK